MEPNDSDGITVIEIGDIRPENGSSQSSSPGNNESTRRNRGAIFGSIDDIIDSDRNGNGKHGNARTGRTRTTNRSDRTGTDTGTDARPGESRTETQKIRVPVRRKSELQPEQLNLLFVLFFGILAGSFGAHWSKDSSQTYPLAEAITEYIKSLPKATGKKVEAVMNPFSILLGAIFLFSEPIKIQKELNESKKRNRVNGVSKTPDPRTGINQNIRETNAVAISTIGNNGRNDGGFPDIDFTSAGN